MLNTLAEYCTNWLTKNTSLPEDEKPIYVYGFELLFSTLSSFFSILVIAFCIKRIIYAVCFFIFFYILRLFCGGYHAKTYTKCFLITNLSFLLITVLSELIIIFDILYLLPIIIPVSKVIIFFFSPIVNENHPCSAKSIKRNKIISIIISLIFELMLIMLYISKQGVHITVNGSLSFFWAALMVLYEKIKQKGE